jgi:hypothetical protein
MDSKTLLLLIVFVPLAGAFLLPVAGKVSSKLRNALAFCFVLIPFGLLLSALPAAISGAPHTFSISLPLGLSFGFLADGLAGRLAVNDSGGVGHVVTPLSCWVRTWCLDRRLAIRPATAKRKKITRAAHTKQSARRHTPRPAAGAVSFRLLSNFR